MMQWKRLFFFLLINIFVSAVTTLLVLTLWDRAHQVDKPQIAAGPTDLVIPTEFQGQDALADSIQGQPTSTPGIPLQAYQVAAGETLGQIAFAFDITVEELLEINGYTDPDSIGAGATIFVPIPGQVEPDQLAAAGESDLPGEPLSPGSSPQAEIVAVIGAGDLRSERVQIRGLGEGMISLTGWRLRDQGDHVYSFPQITLFANGAVDVYSTAGVDTVVALYWNAGEALWQSGETAVLIDNDGFVQAVYTLP
jgi:LysM repeat protein